MYTLLLRCQDVFSHGYVYRLISAVASCLGILHFLPDRKLALINLTVVVQGQASWNHKASVGRTLHLLLEARNVLTSNLRHKLGGELSFILADARARYFRINNLARVHKVLVRVFRHVLIYTHCLLS